MCVCVASALQLREQLDSETWEVSYHLKGLAIERQHQHAAGQDRKAVPLVARRVEGEGAEAPVEDARAEEGLPEEGGQRASSAVVESLA